jgi:hypothetical protein
MSASPPGENPWPPPRPASNGKAVDAGQVYYFKAQVPVIHEAFALFHCHAGVIPHLVMGTGYRVEKARLARVGIAGQRDG